MDQAGPDRVGDRRTLTRRGWRRWVTWGNLALLLAAAVLPFGWLLPAARLARVRAKARRRPDA